MRLSDWELMSSVTESDAVGFGIVTRTVTSAGGLCRQAGTGEKGTRRLARHTCSEGCGSFRSNPRAISFWLGAARDGSVTITSRKGDRLQLLVGPRVFLRKISALPGVKRFGMGPIS